MNAFRQYWSFSAIRGVLTLIVAAGIVVLPHFAAALVHIPVLIGFAIDVLAVYAMLDAGALLLLGISIPAAARRGRVMFLQAVASVAIGACLFVVTHGQFAQYLFYIVALQAAVAATSEFLVARDTNRQYRCLSCYATAMVLAACAVCLPFANALAVEDQILALAGYAALYGLTQFSLGARMLFVEYRAEHPAPQLSEAWRDELTLAAAADDDINLHAANRPYVIPGQGARMVPAYQHAA